MLSKGANATFWLPKIRTTSRAGPFLRPLSGLLHFFAN